MSSSPHTSKPNQEHGTMSSYVIGFVLSLVFTIIPYFLVVNQTVTGTVLQVTILGFAVLQMIIQITFFLHLGRGPKPNWNFFFFIATVSLILFIVTASILIMNHLHYNMSPSEQTKKLVNDEAIYQIGGVETGACHGTKDNHKVVISGGKVSPAHTTAHQCDTLTFINEDDAVRDLSFGSHPDQVSYAGESEVSVRKGRTETITLSESGEYMFHDHLDETVTGHFSVAPQ
jgi:cytochrome o ubiquinol oxidase operon protein cyoD